MTDSGIPFFDMIKRMPQLHCARGPLRCLLCQEAEREGESWSLIRTFTAPGAQTRPLTALIVNDRKIYREYDVLRRFASAEEAFEYAAENRIPIFEDR